jgi:hypothetical protein
VNSIFAKSFKDGTSPWTVFESVVDDNDDGGMGLSTVAKRGMKQFVTVIRNCQREMKKVGFLSLSLIVYSALLISAALLLR